MSTSINLKLEVINSYEHPKLADLLTQELSDMSSRLEEDPDYTEEDAFIVHAFEGDYEGVDEPKQQAFYTETLRELSVDFPELVFALNVFSAFEESDNGLIRREYYCDGKKQVVEPYVVVPDFDPEGELT